MSQTEQPSPSTDIFEVLAETATAKVETGVPGRYQVVVTGDSSGVAILLDTMTGRTWFAIAGETKTQGWLPIGGGPSS